MLARNSALSDSKCIGNRKNMQFYFDYVKELAKSYNKNGFFGFIFVAEYSHDVDKRNLNKIDFEFYNFLKEFQTNKDLFGNTILVIFSDHGPRYTHLRKSVQGLLNERNPFFSIYLPSSFQDKYQSEYKNLQSNSDKLITPMDIHRTFMSLIDMETGKREEKIKEWFKKDQRSISLFDPIESTRTCQEAGISDHWCACLKRRQLDLNNKDNFNFTQSIGGFFINYLNNEILKDHSNECENLKLKKIENIYALITYIDTNKKTVTNTDKRFLQEPNIEKDFRKFFIQLETSPNNGIYEATILGEFDINQGYYTFFIDKEEISRINKYGSDPQCIYEKFPDIRKYCLCKSPK